MRAQAVLVALALVLAPLGAQAADLVVWWEKGYYAEEDEAVREIIAAFEQETGEHVELTLLIKDELPGKIAAALEAGQSARLRLRPDACSTSRSGPSTTGSWTSRRHRTTFRTCSILMCSTGRCS